MSRVRYVNKKTGWVSIYESESNYDPETKKSRPKRKYIGHEDPITKEFIPSSGKAGRKKKTESAVEADSIHATEKKKGSYYRDYKNALDELNRLRAENSCMRDDLLVLCEKLENIGSYTGEAVESIRNIKGHWAE